MSGSPWGIPAVGAAEAAGGSIALWRQAQAQFDALSGPQAPQGQPTSQDAHRDEAATAQPVMATPSAGPALPATPHRLSSLQADPSHLAHTWRQQDERRGQRQDPADADSDDAAAHRDEQANSAWGALESEHWLASLARRWSRSESPDARRALQLARTQWAQGRRVLLACASSPFDASGAAARPAAMAAGDCDGWAVLLMGQSGASGLSLDGPRWPVRLSWREPLPADRWCCARSIKEASGLTWQMKPVPEGGAERADTALVIGPALETQRRWERLGVVMPQGTGFRGALGTQWSLWLLATRGCWMDR